ncbi:MAG TPA: N-acetyltransferase [Clostridia bacterium]|nr:N-acetyltransferase [Clostridia bacterium]MDD3093382.1 N-acetyltransferase [Clostridia bacterium]HPJ76529.1 N-acetyltransferase [Clostridia bacterium]HXK73032.1 N-acetyltransferase [Clostridia bacterium]
MEIDIKIRQVQPRDYHAVEELTREAFWNHYVPGCDEHYLMHIIHQSDSYIPQLDMLALIDDKIVGNIVYTKANVLMDNDELYDVITFGPISVLPEYQKKGIGGRLIKHTIKLAEKLGHKAILIYGDFDYYCRYGFIQAEKYKIGTSHNTYIPSLQAYEIVKGYLKPGRFFEDKIYDIDEEKAKIFDKNFPFKKLKEGLESQKRFSYLIGLSKPRRIE